LDEGKEGSVVFCDISKAFDRVWHQGLLRKLESIGIRGSLLSWVNNYLSERKQRVVINNSTSSWRDINAGVHHFTYIAKDNSHFLTFIQRSTKFICDVQGLINGRISRIKTRLMGSCSMFS
jgi:hypothetical protein